MSCPDLKESLFLHAHGQLEGPSRGRVERHLRRCPACQAQHAAWQQESRLWRSALSAELELNGSASRLRNAVAERIRSEPRPAGGRASRRAGELVSSSSPTRQSTNPPTRKLTHWPSRKLARLLALAALLTIALNALAAYSPPLRRGAARLWYRVTGYDPACDQPLPINRTPPGGTEDPGGGQEGRVN